MLLFSHFLIILMLCMIQPLSLIISDYRLQTRAAKRITGAGPGDSRSSIFKELSWLSIQHQQDFHKCILVFKCRHDLVHQYLIDWFISNNTKHNHNTRNVYQLWTPKARTTYYYHCFSTSTQKLWNDLPKINQNFTTLASFKITLHICHQTPIPGIFYCIWQCFTLHIVYILMCVNDV